jgi:hypothetical protein
MARSVIVPIPSAPTVWTRACHAVRSMAAAVQANANARASPTIRYRALHLPIYNTQSVAEIGLAQSAA